MDNLWQYDMQRYNKYIAMEGLGSLTDSGTIHYNYNIVHICNLIPYLLLEILHEIHLVVVTSVD